MFSDIDCYILIQFILSSNRKEPTNKNKNDNISFK